MLLGGGQPRLPDRGHDPPLHGGSPRAAPARVLAAYLARVENKTYKGSCIYHGPRGCALPREMRSGTCIRYFCAGLKDFRRELYDPDPVRGFFVSTDCGTIYKASFIDEDAAHAVPVPATDVDGGPNLQARRRRRRLTGSHPRKLLAPLAGLMESF